MSFTFSSSQNFIIYKSAFQLTQVKWNNVAESRVGSGVEGKIQHFFCSASLLNVSLFRCADVKREIIRWAREK